MKYLMQFGIIIGLSLLGEVLHSAIPLPVPSSVWGMVILFILLCLKVIKLEQVEHAADFLLSIMTVMFVPVGAGLITSYPAIKNDIIGIFVIIIISTVVCFFVTGKVAQFIINKKSNEISEDDSNA
ncbi:Antiholin-like protein LrgA [bioreactor metagenome]|uniref:Antiholin-like protein LrgA n=1 Tax=bioreactor metagenome TaxID=1076179 RepID=A0A644Z0V6_9ZZZZ|nr:CidA/LrgA family protein [Candidatus Metalachnospira sp.]